MHWNRVSPSLRLSLLTFICTLKQHTHKYNLYLHMSTSSERDQACCECLIFVVDYRFNNCVYTQFGGTHSEQSPTSKQKKSKSLNLAFSHFFSFSFSFSLTLSTFVDRQSFKHIICFFSSSVQFQFNIISMQLIFCSVAFLLQFVSFNSS